MIPIGMTTEMNRGLEKLKKYFSYYQSVENQRNMLSFSYQITNIVPTTL